MKENEKICIYPCEVLKFNILLFKLNIPKKNSKWLSFLRHFIYFKSDSFF